MSSTVCRRVSTNDVSRTDAPISWIDGGCQPRPAVLQGGTRWRRRNQPRPHRPNPAPTTRGSAGPSRAAVVEGHNDVVLGGRVSGEPTVRVLPSGDELLSWRLVVGRDNQRHGGQSQQLRRSTPSTASRSRRSAADCGALGRRRGVRGPRRASAPLLARGEGCQSLRSRSVRDQQNHAAHDGGESRVEAEHAHAMPDRGFGKNKVDFLGMASPTAATARLPASGAGLRNSAIPLVRSREPSAACGLVLGFDLPGRVGDTPTGPQHEDARDARVRVPTTPACGLLALPPPVAGLSGSTSSANHRAIADDECRRRLLPSRSSASRHRSRPVEIAAPGTAVCRRTAVARTRAPARPGESPECRESRRCRRRAVSVRRPTGRHRRRRCASRRADSRTSCSGDARPRSWLCRPARSAAIVSQLPRR